jgi:hypothetical protein
MDNINEYYYSNEFIDIINKIQIRRKRNIHVHKSYPIVYISSIILDNAFYMNNNEYRLPIDLYNYIQIHNKILYTHTDIKILYTHTDIDILVKQFITNIDYNKDLFKKYIVIGYEPHVDIKELNIYL